MYARATLVLVLTLVCVRNGAAQPHPADTLPFEHWAYDYAEFMNESLDGALSRAWYGDNLWSVPPLTRYKFAIGILQALGLMRESEITAEEAGTPRSLHLNVSGPLGESGALNEVWREMATEFLPSIITAGEPVAYVSAGPAPLWPSPVPDEPQPTNLAIRDLRAVPHDHWLYADAQRVLWAAAEMDYTDASSEAASPADTVTWKHWGYQSLHRLAPVAFPDRDTSFLDDRAMVRYEFAMFAFRTLRELLEIEQPTPEQQDLAVTWALLALEFWPEFVELQADMSQMRRPEMPGMRWIDGGTATVASDIYSVPEDHWLYPIVTRVLEIAERND